MNLLHTQAYKEKIDRAQDTSNTSDCMRTTFSNFKSRGHEADAVRGNIAGGLQADLDAEEHRSHFSQPLWIHCSDALHILLAGVHQLMVHNIIWSVAKSVQGTARVQEAGHAAAAVVVLSNALELGCIVEVGAADGFADNVPVRA